MGYSGLAAQRGDPGSNGGATISVFDACVFEKPTIVLYGSRRLMCLIVQLRKIVMRGGVVRCKVQRSK
jgi:hypothetical protein